MESPFSSGASHSAEVFAASAERFFELLKGFTAPGTGADAATPDWTQLAAPLATQFEHWLRSSQAAGPWFSGPAGITAGMGPAFGAASGWSFGPLPLGLAAVPHPEGQRVFELLGRLTQLQTQRTVHWSQIARSAAQRFVARAGTPATAPSPAQMLKLYEVWVTCAEEAYAETARSEEFSRLQSELANVSAALLVEQRRQAESLVRAFGLPTRNEVDVLYAHIKELTRQLAQLQERAAKPTPAPVRPVPRARKAAKRRGRPAAGKRARRS
jgi:hypothetical protein